MKKHATAVAAVTAGVIVAGFIMAQLSDVDIIQKARNGFQGVV